MPVTAGVVVFIAISKKNIIFALDYLFCNCTVHDSIIDIREDDLRLRSPELLDILLTDHTMSREKGKPCNIFWATADYEHLGPGFQYHEMILAENITGEHGTVVQPRVCKRRETQRARSRDKAEVFTPSWLCNAQCNSVDAEWFGREGVFNTETSNKSWIINPEPVTFPDGKTWRDYIRTTQLEITCGEAPYIASRYDTVSGEYIPIERRIGMIDRKLRIVGENCHTEAGWLEAAIISFQSTYGFEWQGDSLLIARETLVYTFIEYFRHKFGKDPNKESVLTIADIVSWNLWQMDGLKCVVPDSCIKEPETQPGLFGDDDAPRKRKKPQPLCPGCRNHDYHTHTGVYCEIKDWEADEVLTFVSLMKKHK